MVLERQYKIFQKTLLNQLKKIDNQKFTAFEKIQATCGLNIAKVNCKTSQNIFWDLGGQKLLRSIWKKYYPECHGLIFMIDSKDQNRFQEVKTCFIDAMNNVDLQGVPTLIILNKMDLNDEEINFAELLELDKLNREFNMQKISAIQNINVQDSINWLIQVINVFGKKNLHSIEIK